MRLLNVKSLFTLFSLLWVTLFSVGCAEIGPKPSNQAIAGNWIKTSIWDDGTIPQKQPVIVTSTLNLRKDGTYEEFCESRSTKTNVKWQMYFATGTWDIKNDMLILNQKNLEAGIVPKKKQRKIISKIVMATQASLSLKRNHLVTTYTKGH